MLIIKIWIFYYGKIIYYYYLTNVFALIRYKTFIALKGFIFCINLEKKKILYLHLNFFNKFQSKHNSWVNNLLCHWTIHHKSMLLSKSFLFVIIQLMTLKFVIKWLPGHLNKFLHRIEQLVKLVESVNLLINQSE